MSALAALVAAALLASPQAPAVVPEDKQVVTVKVAKPKPKPCKDPLVRTLKNAGFKGIHVRVAYAVAMRESNGQAGESTMPDLGLFQLNSPAWSGSKYWPDNVLDGEQNAAAARLMVRDKGWGPWGLSVRNGEVGFDFSSYSMWSDWQKTNWVVIPFQKYWAQFPKECR